MRWTTPARHSPPGVLVGLSWPGCFSPSFRPFLDSDLEPIAGRAHLDVSGHYAETVLDPGGDDLAFVDELGEAPLFAVLAHAHDDPTRTSPDALPRRLEPARDQLAKLLRYRFGRWFRRRPNDRL